MSETTLIAAKMTAMTKRLPRKAPDARGNIFEALVPITAEVTCAVT